MKTINKSYKLRIYPTKEQEVLMSKHFGCSRFVYNYFLADRISYYEETKKTLRYNQQAKKLTTLKQMEEFSWLYEVSSSSLQDSLRTLDSAFENFFNSGFGYPKFKSKRGSRASFTTYQDGKIRDGKLCVTKFQEGIKIRITKNAKDKLDKVGKVTISRNPDGKYYASILTEQQIEEFPKTGKQVGIDLGLKDFLITSDGEKYKNNRYTRKYAKKLKQAQQHLMRKEKGSFRYEKQRLKVARIHSKIANSRLDNLHKTSLDLVRRYDFIAAEDLNVKSLIKEKKLSKHISDASWGTFLNLLTYKCDWYGKELVKIDRYFPSSKKCQYCGAINETLTIDNRKWTCTCGKQLDRDINASINILQEGLRIKSVGTIDNTNGETSKTSLRS